MTDEQREEIAMTEQTDRPEPTEQIERGEPPEPVERGEPTEPVDRPEPTEPVERGEPTERSEPTELLTVVDRPEPSQRLGPSVPTIVWGLIFALIAAAVIGNQVSDVDVNIGLTGPIVLLAAGAVLLVWGVAGIGRTRRR